MRPWPKLSITIPVYNEEECLPELYRRVRDALDELPGGPHELIFVDDGSSDGSGEILSALAGIDPRVSVIVLSRNFGHQAALTAALDHAAGEAVVMMDCDLQDTPETIPRFVEKYREGYDVVYATRVKRKEGLLLRACYAAAYQIIDSLSEIRLPRAAGDFSLLSRRVVDSVRRSQETHRYLRGLRAWVGYRQIGIPVERDARTAGRSKYSVKALFRLAFDGIFSFSVVPLRAATLVGAISIVASMLFAGYNVFAKLFLGLAPQGFTAIICSLTFLSGVQLFFLGIIGEYVGRIYNEVKRRPHYIVDRLFTTDGRPAAVSTSHELADLDSASIPAVTSGR